MVNSLVVFGSLVVDETLHIDNPYAYVGQAISWNPGSKTIMISRNAVVQTPFYAPPAIHALIMPLESGEFKSGEKVNALPEGGYGPEVNIDTGGVRLVKWDEGENQMPGCEYSKFLFPKQSLGGGGTNVCFALHAVFRNIPKRYISVSSKYSDKRVEDGLSSLFDVGELRLLDIDPLPPVNIVIEGIGDDRFLVKSPRKRDVFAPYQEAEAEVCMVNTVYPWHVAVNALIEALRAKRGGVIACTIPLCDFNLIPENIGAELADLTREKLGGDFKDSFVRSIYSFIRDVVMKRSDNLVYIFNEAELAHFAREKRKEFGVLNLNREAIFSGVVRALHWLRSVQDGAKPEIIVTLGKHGTLYLDKEDDLHFCSVLLEQEIHKAVGNKNAIGDLFAAMVLGIHYARGGRGIVPILAPDGDVIKYSYVPSTLIASTAAAEDGVYNGFMRVDPQSINRLIELKVPHYSFFGSIYDIALGETEDSVEEMLTKGLTGLRKGSVEVCCSLDQLVDDNLLTATMP
jgi:hypothetical protein